MLSLYCLTLVKDEKMVLIVMIGSQMLTLNGQTANLKGTHEPNRFCGHGVELLYPISHKFDFRVLKIVEILHYFHTKLFSFINSIGT
jgi:hypothetical protein